MAKRTLEEITTAFNEIVGDRQDDAVLSFLEDITDSYDSNNVDWRTKYEELDNEWRTRYKNRFMGDETTYTSNETTTESEADTITDDETETDLTYEDLFD